MRVMSETGEAFVRVIQVYIAFRLLNLAGADRGIVIAENSGIGPGASWQFSAQTDQAFDHFRVVNIMAIP
jgi:hypothetical protein